MNLNDNQKICRLYCRPSIDLRDCVMRRGGFPQELKRKVRESSGAGVGSGHVQGTPTLEEIINQRKSGVSRRLDVRENLRSPIRRKNANVQIEDDKNSALEYDQPSYRSSGDVDMLEQLRSQVNGMLKRIVELEEQSVAENRRSNQQEMKVVTSPETVSRSNSLRHESLVESMQAIQATLNLLESTFDKTEEIFVNRTEKSLKSAVLLQSRVRGFLQYRRHQKFLLARSRWQQRNGLDAFKTVAREHSSRAKKIQENMIRFSLKRAKHTLNNVFDEWKFEMLHARPSRRLLLETVETKRIIVLHRLMGVVLRKWYDIANGPRSKKNVALAYRTRFENCRRRLIEQQRSSDHKVVTKEIVMGELAHEAYNMIVSRRESHMLRIFFKAWSDVYMQAYNQLKERAERFFRKTLFPSYFYLWRKVVDMRLEAARVRVVWDRSRFDMEHNTRVVENFRRHLILRKHMSAWKKITYQNTEVRRRYHSYLMRLSKSVFAVWKSSSRYQHEIKRVCIDEWREVDQRLGVLPFRLWYIHTKNVQRRNLQTDFLMEAFQRRRLRILMTRCFRIWNHQAIFGRVSGMQSRAELVRTLESQRKLLMSMETCTQQQNATITELEDMLDEEKLRSVDFVAEISKRVDEVVQVKCALQKAEEEVLRMRAKLNTIAEIHPGTISRLAVKDPNNSFIDDHKLQLLAHRYATENPAELFASNDRSTESSTLKTGNPSSCPECSKRAIHRLRRCKSAIELGRQEGELTAAAEPLSSEPDAAIAIRARWAYEKMSEIAVANVKEGMVDTRYAGFDNGIELSNLRSLIAFIWTGDVKVLHRQEENKYEEPLNHGTNHGALRKLEAASLHDALNWNEFVNGTAKAFPLVHPGNKDTRLELSKRMVTSKLNEKSYFQDPEKRKVNIYVSN